MSFRGKKCALCLFLFLDMPVYSKRSITAWWIIYVQQVRQKGNDFLLQWNKRETETKCRHEQEEKMNEHEIIMSGLFINIKNSNLYVVPLMNAICFIHIKSWFPKHWHNEHSYDCPWYMKNSIVSDFHALCHSSQQPYEIGTIINSILQMKKRRKRG